MMTHIVKQIRSVAPIKSIALKSRRIEFRPEATPEQRAAAEALLAEWDPSQPAPPTVDDYERAIQAHIDATARQRTYRSGDACATYVNSTTPQWAAEAQAFVAWRDAVWAHAFGELAKVEQGQRAQPTVKEFIAELPKIQWP